MRSKMTKRTRTALLAGVALLVAGGGGAAYLGTRNAAVDTNAGKVTAYYANVPVQVGTAASTALADGSIRSRSVLPAELPADGVRDPSQLSGRVAGVVIPAGSLVTTSMFPAPQTRIGTVVIPAGKRALALEMPPMAGVAGFVGAGDRIDVYGVVKGDPGPPSVRLVLQGVDVLSVNGAGLPAAQGQPGSPNLIYLLAVTPPDAERLIFLDEFEKLYFDLVPKGEGPVKTPGTGPAGALAV
ncbi:MAG TPA: Flp pilus assembly protein CpaB [Acidimicrobiales bacterium]|nr:Flp pilus assembly protein CpaB [Acidimicrobiales bacterium]